MADRLSQYPMLSNFNNNMLQQQQLQQQQPPQQHQDSPSILSSSALDQAMIWQQMQQQPQFRPHGAVDMNSHAPAQVRIPPSFLFIFPIATVAAVGARPHFLHSFLSSGFALHATIIIF
jgi:hypothetical protein